MKQSIRAARINIGLTQTEAANNLNINVDTLSKYERNSSKITRDLILKMEHLYFVDANHIFFGDESEFYRIRRMQRDKHNTEREEEECTT
ncbi:helix-turn-helix domain-containing protein [Staphylococcus gallinarum]|uniref:helix-turn-helix domain-containing protein n=2 Tax=Staphylococcus gallinarum TaxID=1293 RepID=UPI000D1E6B37|nr:helix-turn-helix transcriptional regulator [Staphylococcus gallinarum]PTK92440.1 XRE family transcriptional regulator [Staphylococcus gallinarum]RIL23730.1 XRE family transcriptional regulator [Staphylococcus gallinarum]RIL28919.1 XRE family transcriptional regulator [Staphylococcus gallinarum]